MKIQDLFTSKERTRLEAQSQKLQKQLEELTQALEAQKEHTDTLLSQERLERQAQVDALKFERDELQAQKDEEARRRSDFEIQLLTLQNEAAALNEIKESETKTKAQIQAQRDAFEHENQALISVRDTLLQEKSDIDAIRNQVSSTLAVVQEQLSTIQTEKESLLARAQEFEGKEKFFQEENELLLLQLHQVQEELEHYFLENQKSLEQLNLMRIRFDRLMERNPDYVAYDALKTTPLPNGMGLHCELTNVSMANINAEAIAFDLIVEEGVAGFVFDKDKELSRSTLLRWPEAARESTSLELIPLVDMPKRPRASALFGLATRDWKMAQGLPALCKNIIQNPATQLPPSASSRSDWLAALEMTQTIFNRLPARLRWDAVRLKRHKANVDYEFLWLEFDALTFGAKTLPKFDMRFSCVIPSFDKFGQSIKLEFPKESGESALEGWFAESRDEFGEKFELRFALPNSMDTKTWSQITTPDRTFIYLLANNLPEILQETLMQEGLTITRAPSDWVSAAVGVRQYLRTLVASMQKNTQPPLQKGASMQSKVDVVDKVETKIPLPQAIKKSAAKKVNLVNIGSRKSTQKLIKSKPTPLAKVSSTIKASQKLSLKHVNVKSGRAPTQKIVKVNSTSRLKK